MGGVHGDMLSYFPELMGEYDVFSMKPIVGAGFGPEKIEFPQVEGYFSRNKGGKESVVVDARTENQQATFWCEDDIPKAKIRQGLYMRDDGELYTFVYDNSYVREAGFTRHQLQIVTGNTPNQEQHVEVNIGLDEYQ